MTEQPVETEQQFLGNVATAPIQAYIGTEELGEVELVALPEIPLQHYAPGAHRLPPAWTPGDDVELSALVRASVKANKLLAITKAEAKKAEDALSLALLVEEEAHLAVRAADEALIAFTRKDTGL